MTFLSILLISMFITMALLPILRLAAERWRCGLDVPDARKVHCVPVPKVGGIAMAAGALLPVLFVVDGGAFVNSVLIGAWIIVAFGVLDDFKNLGWKAKFAGQVIAALVVILHGGLEICFLGACLPEGVRLHAALGIPLTLLVIVGVTNAINLSDGLDGLAGGTSLLIFLSILFLCYTTGDFPERFFIMLLCTAMVGAIFGFLRFNTYPATVFMGDAGSQLLGFLAVTLSLGITQRELPLSPFLPLLLLGFPVLDTLTVMVERIASGRMPFSPDQNHFHHKLMRLGLYHTESVVAIYAITAMLVVAAYLLRFHSEWLLIGCFAAFCGLVVLAFTAAERRGFRFQRTGFFDLELKGRLKILKEKNLPIRASFAVLHYGLPLLFAAAALIPAEVPVYGSAAAAGLAAVIGLTWVVRTKWLASVLRLTFYLFAPFLLRIGQEAPAEWIAPALLKAYGIGFGVLALCMVLTLKFTQRKRGFKATTMDFLILVIALVVPNLPDPTIRASQMGQLAVQIIVFFFGFEVLLGELRGNCGRLTIGVLAGLVLLSLRGIIN
jgi:UDP-GlcNAc:undecaprenyl-phosphate/decaprenyl-phosphate GlcNAc-1-phosphate transferase